jgi:hypothetical protein
LAPRKGSEINSRACLWVLPRSHHRTQCWLTNQRLILFRISHLETPRAGSGPRNPRTVPPLACSSAISIPRTPNMSRDPVQPHCMPGRDIVQYLLALLDQWRRSDGLKSFQSCPTIRTDTYVFLWSILKLNFINTGQDSIYLGLKDSNKSS